MNESSGFISQGGVNGAVHSDILEQITPLTHTSGGTSLVYSVCIKGKMYFMKQLRPEYNRELLYRSMFMKEYELGRRIDNRHIVRYQTIDENADGLYLLAEYVKGRNIAEKIEAEPEFFRNTKNTKTLLAEMLDGLKALHGAGVVHLDLKPGNVMLAQVNNEVKIVDLGFAFESSYQSTIGTTPEFAAPEVQEGRMDEIDARSDLYSVGRIMEHISLKCGVSLDKSTQRVVKRCLNQGRSLRYDSAEDALADLYRSDRKKVKMAVCCTLLALAALVYYGIRVMNETHWFKDFKNSVAWTLRQVDKDTEFTHVYYKITSHKDLTCQVVGGSVHPNPMIVDKVEIGNRHYSVTGIKDSAFWQATHITSVYIPDGIESIGIHAFRECHGLCDVDLPASVRKLGLGAFYECYGIVSCQLSPSLTIIPAACFALNINLREVNIPYGVKLLGFDCFSGCESLKSIVLPQGLEVIERGVFYNCYALEEISIPNTVRDIGEYTFFHCRNLKNVYIHSTIPPAVSRIFADNHKDLTIHVPESSVEAYRSAQHWREMNIKGMSGERLTISEE
jgi:tRNA A-37 threonylcarbamoyl transferase component Bud32